MSRYGPRSQSRGLMTEKRKVAHRLLSEGLTIQQVATQLRCSPTFVRRVREEGRRLYPSVVPDR
jgi:hypothetical protein